MKLTRKDLTQIFFAFMKSLALFIVMFIVAIEILVLSSILGHSFNSIVEGISGCLCGC